jgi:tetratricopeptide (TPR) repeat protein
MNYWLSAPRYRGAEVALIGMSEHQAWCLGRMSAFAYLYPGVTVRRFQSAPSEADDAAPRLVLYVSERGFADTSPLPVAADADHAKAVFAQGKYAEALALYEKLIRSDPESAEAQYHYAFCLHMAGRLAEAEAPYTRALQLDPLMDRLVRYNRGAVYLYTGRIGLAEEDLKRALVMDPANPGVRVYWDELLKRKAAAQ